MEITNDTQNRKGPVLDPALCRCCRTIKKCRLLTKEYEWLGKKEVYSDMIMDCFGLLLSHLDGDDKDNCICATCVARLREASAFRKQVLYWEEALLQAKLDLQKDDDKQVVEVKLESSDDDGSRDAPCPDDGFQNVSDSEDATALSQLKIVKTESTLTKPKLKKVITRKVSKCIDKPKKDLLLKRKLLNEMKKTKSKLNKQKRLDEPATSLKKKKTQAIDHDHMVFKNTETIVKNSYVCPFQNRVSNYYCFYCMDQFMDPAELREHTLTHDPKDFTSMTDNKKPPKIDITRIDCRLCLERIDNLTAFKDHVSNVHKKLIYTDVGDEFLKFKLTISNLTCVECNGVFPYFDSLKKHMADHFGTYTCDACGACFLEETSLYSHIRKHKLKESNEESSFPCEICGKNLKSKYSRYLHVATVHEKKPTVNCYKCDECFLSYALRNRHLIEVHGDKRTFPCQLCDKVYNRRKTLMEHHRRNHLKVFRHQCDLCDQKFYLPSRLKEHMVTHTGERNFRCEFCDKSYPRLKSLKEHIRTHTNDRRFKCDICSSSFTQNGSLRSHIKSHHQSLGTEGVFS